MPLSSPPPDPPPDSAGESGSPPFHWMDAADVATVDHPSRLLESAYAQRRRQFHHLVLRYISSTLHGCWGEYCTIPTCLTCQKRDTTKPFRPPTQLTARALAHFLATRDDQDSIDALCPAPLNLWPPFAQYDASPLDNALSYRDDPAAAGGVGHWGQQTSSQDDTRWLAFAANFRQAKKDAKSLSQNLYDTTAVISFISTKWMSPMDVFRMHRYHGQGRTTRHNVSEHNDNPPNVAAEKASGLIDAANVDHQSSALVKAVELPPDMFISAKHASTRQAASPQKRRSSGIVSEVLSTGDSLHKIRHSISRQSINRRESVAKLKAVAKADGVPESPSPMLKNAAEVDINSTPPVLHQAFEDNDQNSDALTNDGTLNDRERSSVLHVVSPLSGAYMSRMNMALCPYPDDEAISLSSEEIRYLQRSLFYNLSDPATLIPSFRSNDNPSYRKSPLPHLDSERLIDAFGDWNGKEKVLIFDSLWSAAEALFACPPELDNIQKSPHLRATRRTLAGFDSEDGPLKYLDDDEAAHLIVICIHALTSSVPTGWDDLWPEIRKTRSSGFLLPQSDPTDAVYRKIVYDNWLKIMDALEFEPALRLASRLIRGIGARRCFGRILESLSDNVVEGSKHQSKLYGHLEEHEGSMKAKMEKDWRTQNEDPGWTVTATFMEWLKTIIVKSWDHKAEINRWTQVGAAVQILGDLHERYEKLNLCPEMFQIPLFMAHLDASQTAIEFTTWTASPNTIHLLQYPFLFSADAHVAFFRAVNFASVSKQYAAAERARHLQSELSFTRDMHLQHKLRDALSVAWSLYLVLDVSREQPLADALDQLWGIQKREILLPLKVRMGSEEGERGVDQGGVTVEFFRVAMQQALDPQYGMFTIDPKTQMTWFQPLSAEKAHKFELLGLLFSLAIYNGITLPVTFPIAFYHLLLKNAAEGLPTIRDGWPDLAKSFDALLAYEGDVEEDLQLDYRFTFDAYGDGYTADMLSHPFDPPQTAVNRCYDTQNAFESYVHRTSDRDNNEPVTPVTNANRAAFVRDYTFHLVFRSVAPQFRAFKRGFRRCLNRRSLQLFTPASLKSLVEGQQDYRVCDLWGATSYEDGYTVQSRTIKHFWSIVKEYNREERLRLLAFVTASDRVPVTGVKNVVFTIVRNGRDTELLPTSSTCFGKLMLPEYSSKEKLRAKLRVAIYNNEGFGIA